MATWNSGKFPFRPDAIEGDHWMEWSYQTTADVLTIRTFGRNQIDAYIGKPYPDSMKEVLLDPAEAEALYLALADYFVKYHGELPEIK